MSNDNLEIIFLVSLKMFISPRKKKATVVTQWDHLDVRDGSYE